MTTTIGPALGHGPWTQQGVGTSPGYDAIDVRRLMQGVAAEGVLSSGGFVVTQRAAGANMSVDIAASTGEGARVQGDAVTLQGLYYVPPHSAAINEAISTADGSNPRNDLVVLEIKDTQHDSSGSNLAQVRVIAGTPNASAAKTDALGANGTPTLPSSAIALAVVNVPASDTSITDAQIDDRRPTLWRPVSGGKCIIATEESRTNTAYGTLTTPDVVKGIVLPTDGLIFVAYQAMWKESVNAAAMAAIFVGSNQLKAAEANSAAPVVLETNCHTAADTYAALASATSRGLIGSSGTDATAYTGDVTTGQLVGGRKYAFDYTGDAQDEGGPALIFAAAGTYDISIRFKASSGSVTAKNRKLWVWTLGFG